MATSNEKLRELKMGDDVTVIPANNGQIIDVSQGLLFRAGVESKTKLTGFVMDQLVLGNLLLSDDEEAPKSNGSVSEDELRYEGAPRETASRSKPTEDAFGESDGSGAKEDAENGYPAPKEKDEIPQGGRTGEKGTSKAKKSDKE